MEKTADNQYRVYNESGQLLMRHPGGKITPYCGEFGYLCEQLSNEGDEALFIKNN